MWEEPPKVLTRLVAIDGSRAGDSLWRPVVEGGGGGGYSYCSLIAMALPAAS